MTIAATLASGANFRSSPSKASAANIIRTLASGTTVYLEGNVGAWLNARVGTERGYVHATVVTPFTASQVAWRSLLSTTTTIGGGTLSAGRCVDVVGLSGESLTIAWDDGTAALAAANTNATEAVQLPSAAPYATNELQAERARIDALSAASRAEAYAALQLRVKYNSQRDNKATLGGARVETTGGAMCNLTALAMCLSTVGVANPNSQLDFADELERQRQVYKLGDRSESPCWEALAARNGASFRLILDQDLVTTRSWWTAEALPALQAGDGVMFSIGGHIVRLAAIHAKGLIVDDPYGHCILKAGTGSAGRSWIARNPYQRAGGPLVGEKALWTWAEVELHTMHWVGRVSPAPAASALLAARSAPAPRRHIREDGHSGEGSAE